jgi:hypothetical protein
MLSPMIDSVIGVVLVLSLFSLACSTITEIANSFMRTRAKNLRRAIRQMLGDEDLVKAFYEHPLILSVSKGGKEKPTEPSYIAPQLFSAALFDILHVGPHATTTPRQPADSPIDIIIEQRTRHPTQPLQRTLSSLSRMTEPQQVVATVDNWYNDAMERASGVYTRHVRKQLFAIGLFVAAVFNIDPLNLARVLSTNDVVRPAVVEQAQSIVHQGKSATASDSSQAAPSVDAAIRLLALETVGIPFGWSKELPSQDPCGYPRTLWNAITKILGLFLTAIATMLGAQFWFDLLGRVVSLRATAKPSEKREG